jgi:hypothetical protein
LNPVFVASDLAESDGFLWAIKICSTPSFGGELKLSVPHHKILWHAKNPYKYERDTL